jgi:GT2 family glycosyltransferase
MPEYNRIIRRLWGSPAQFGAMIRKALRVLITKGPASLVGYTVHKLQNPYLKFDEVGRRPPADVDDEGYKSWIRLHEPTPVSHRHADSMGEKPIVSLCVLWDQDNVKNTLQSILHQTYARWEVLVVGPSTAEADASKIWKALARGSTGWRYAYIPLTSKNPALAVESALEAARGDFLALIHAGDELAPHALETVVVYLHGMAEADLIYSDQDRFDQSHNRVSPFFKPDFSPVLLRQANYVGHLCLFSTDLLRDVYRTDFGASLLDEHSLVLRTADKARQIIHIPEVLYHQQHDCAPSIVVAPRQSSRRTDVQRNGDSQASVDILIPTRDHLSLLAKCIEGIKSTEYPGRITITIIDNGSRDRRTLRYLRQTSHAVISAPGPFNFSHLVNEGARHTHADMILLLNNDIEVIEPTWLHALVDHLNNRNVGVVGPRLLYPDRRVQHAGVILGLGDIAGHAFWLNDGSSPGYYGLQQLSHEVSAVTGACMITRRTVFEEVGGFREDLPVNFNDIAYCLTVRRKGYSVVYAADTELIHHESASRVPRVFPAERARFVEVFGHTRNDPFYSPHLSHEPAHSYALELDYDRV